MSTNLPSKLSDLVNWCSTHVDLFDLNHAAIGMSVLQSSAFKGAVETMNAKIAAAQMARQASKDATFEQSEAVSAVRSIAGELIAQTKVFASTSNNMTVYSLAGISPDAPPTPLGPPNTPTQLSASVNPDGSLNLTFKAVQPRGMSGVQYRIFRRYGTTLVGPFNLVGDAGSNKRFTDTTLPVGVDRVEYMIQPKHNNVYGEQSSVFALQFGSVPGDGGTMQVQQTFTLPHSQPMQVAA